MHNSNHSEVPRGPKPKKAFSRSNIIIYGTLIVISIYYLLPLWVMIMTSLKGMPEIRMGNIFSPPLEITFEPWVKAWSYACTGINCDGLSRGFWNSVKILIPSLILSISVASVNGYALANWKFKGSEVFFTILIFGAFIPYQIMIYPIVILLREIGLMGSTAGLVLVHTIFGMPIPIFVVAMILQVTGIWNDFLFGVIYTKPATYPMTVQLNNIVNSVQGVKEYNVNMAATLLTGLVPLAIYFVSGKLFVRGIAAGAVKG